MDLYPAPDAEVVAFTFAMTCAGKLASLSNLIKNGCQVNGKRPIASFESFSIKPVAAVAMANDAEFHEWKRSPTETDTHRLLLHFALGGHARTTSSRCGSAAAFRLPNCQCSIVTRSREP